MLSGMNKAALACSRHTANCASEAGTRAAAGVLKGCAGSVGSERVSSGPVADDLSVNNAINEIMAKPRLSRIFKRHSRIPTIVTHGRLSGTLRCAKGLTEALQVDIG
jgi:hypothetical protein